MKISDIMRKDFISFQADARLEDVVKAFADKRITSAPVLDGEEYIGMVSDIGLAEYFLPKKKFAFLWIKEKPTPIEEIKKVTAGQLAHKSRVVLRPDQNLSEVLPKIVKRPYCIAVLDKGRLVGIVGGEEITSFFLKELVKGEVSSFGVKGSESRVLGTGSRQLATEIDSILAIVERDGEASAGKIAHELGMSVKTIEKLGDSLSKHKLIEVGYSFFRGPVFKKIRNQADQGKR